MRRKLVLVHTQGHLGDYLDKHGQVVGAEEHFAATVRLRPQTAEAHCGLGVVLASEGKAAEAMAEYSEAQQRLNPGYVQAHNKIEAGIDHTQRRRRRRGEAHAAAPAPAASVARANCGTSPQKPM